MPACQWRFGCSWLGFSTLWQKTLPGAWPSTTAMAAESCGCGNARGKFHLRLCLQDEPPALQQPYHKDKTLGALFLDCRNLSWWSTWNRRLRRSGNFRCSAGKSCKVRTQNELIFPPVSQGKTLCQSMVTVKGSSSGQNEIRSCETSQRS